MEQLIKERYIMSLLKELKKNSRARRSINIPRLTALSAGSDLVISERFAASGSV